MVAMTETPALHALWPAPLADGAVHATVTVPGSKSVTNRALVLAALAAEPGWVRRPLRSRDSQLMSDALRAMGVGIEETVSSSSGDGAGRRGLADHPGGPARPGHRRRRQRGHGHALPAAGRHPGRR